MKMSDIGMKMSDYVEHRRLTCSMWITFLNVRDIASRGSRTWENLEPETFSDAILIKNSANYYANFLKTS